VGEFNTRFAVKPAQRGTAFPCRGRSDPDWVFTVHTELVMAKDNTVVIAAQRLTNR
jgi:hypothetical protein